ncbi:hydantoinase/carbamoylase family amidase [Bordetella genomosp. 13]|uniref:hydantoinase/carbamoylase family amidase n=1 Tax=Bordetella genomosp. 13 TaxID=463040 RepID=UPI00119D7316|nr:hydantoinase/carbamoylase family amidase [Bordetella genomosp. 13]
MSSEQHGPIEPAARAAARQQVVRWFDVMAETTADPVAGITRPSYGEGEQFVHAFLRAEAAALGLRIVQDAALNSYMTLPGRDPAAPAIMIGSHLDSVAQGGNFDGAAGVVAGLAALSMLRQQGVAPRGDITVMGVRAEESAWFQTSYIGSRAALGRLSAEALQCRRVDTQATLAEHMRQFGGDPDALLAGPPFLAAGRIRAFMEVHIEQAPSLVEAGVPLGIGTGIPGNFRYPEIVVTGETAHVGLPRRFRRDALVAASRFVARLDDLWRRWEDAGKSMAFTVGRFHTDAANDAMTKVPGDVRFSLDVRAYDEADVARLHEEVLGIVGALQDECGVRFDLGRRTQAPVATVSPDIRAALAALAQARGIACVPLASPASHDAAVFHEAGVPMGLLFVRNRNGSHNPHEAMDIDDFMLAVDVLTDWLLAQG